MLNVTAQRSPEAAKTYFAKSDYLSESQEITGRWGGKGAVLLGLFGQVDKASFDRLCDNINPLTAEQLTPINRSNRRTGYDFTWSAPKSVSVVHALTGDDRIMQAFRTSVSETMGEMEADMQTRVRKGRNDFDRSTGNMLWAEFLHLTSRPVNGLPCPQLHAHCFAFNTTYDPIESRWKAGQFGKIKGDGYYWQAVQQARFANKLQALGYSIHATKDAFEIAGVPELVLKKFSLRTRQIEAVAAKLKISDPKAKAKLAATTREAKNDSVPYPELVKLWEWDLSADERAALRSVCGKPVSLRDESVTHASYAAEHAFERASVIDEKRLLTLAIRHGIGEVTPEGVRTAINKLALLRRDDQGKVLVTTRAVLDEEQRMLRYAVAGKGTYAPLGASHADSLPGQAESFLSREQQAAVSHVLSSPDRVMILRGVAGSGKTTLTREAVGRIEAAGKPVVMLAPSAQASRGVLRDEGFANADTLARFLVDEKMQARATMGVIWLDEAGLVGTKTMSSLFEVADRLNARVVLAGDKRQLGSVERGAALRVLEDIAGLKVAEVTDIRRQAGAYKAAVRLLSIGKTTEGLNKLDAMGWIRLMPRTRDYATIAKDYVEKRNSSRDRDNAVLIVSPTHAEGQKITDEVRNELKRAGWLGANERELTRLIPLQWTEAERGDKRQYNGDEILQFHRNSGDFKAGERITSAQALAAKRSPSPIHFAAYSRGSIRLAEGDIIRITANGKTKDGKHKLNNGAAYAVRGFTTAGDIVLRNGWIVGKEFGFISHGYVTTAWGAQGRTVDHVILAQTAVSYPAGNREGFYVAISRGRKSATIYTDDKHDLKLAIERNSPRLSAVELVQKPKPPLWRRMRERMMKIQLAALVAAKAAASLGPSRQNELAHAR
jgi:conjugative relaxase-like TrwC/TraI family protein